MMVDFPAPDGHTKAIVSPFFACGDMLLKTNVSSLYPKFTQVKPRL